MTRPALQSSKRRGQHARLAAQSEQARRSVQREWWQASRSGARLTHDSEPPRRSAAASSTSLERSSRARAVEPWPHVCTCPRARTMQAKSGGRRTEAGADARLPMAHGSRRATRSYRVPVAGEGGARETPPRAPSTLALGHGSTIGSSTTYSSSSSSDAQSNGASHMRPCRLAAGPHIIGKGRAGLHPAASHGVWFEVGARGGCARAGWRRRAPPVAGSRACVLSTTCCHIAMSGGLQMSRPDLLPRRNERWTPDE